MSSILITGGSGFLGRSLAAALQKDSEYSRICIYSRGEHTQAEMRSQIPPQHLERFRFFVGDVRDLTRLRRAMDGCDAVIHTAALKRVEVGEYCPDEMVRTNVDGTMNVIEAARELGIKKALFISSDKACQPLNAYGATKLLAEKLFLAANGSSTKYSVVRYGNVAGSTGSVLTFWRQQVNIGAPLLVTDPEMTRFWMRLSDATAMVLYWLGEMRGGELAMPDLHAYRLGDLADACISVWGGRVQFIAPRPGEKPHEAMICADEMHDFVSVGDYWVRHPDYKGPPLLQPLTSNSARRLSASELQFLVSDLNWRARLVCAG